MTVYVFVGLSPMFWRKTVTIFFYGEVGDTKFLRNASNHLKVGMVSQLRRLPSERFFFVVWTGRVVWHWWYGQNECLVETLTEWKIEERKVGEKWESWRFWHFGQPGERLELFSQHSKSSLVRREWQTVSLFRPALWKSVRNNSVFISTLISSRPSLIY